MTDSVWPDGVGLRRYGTLDSTNEEAKRLARAHVRGPLWIVAGAQTAGRGRRGRLWVSDVGNLYATLLLDAEGAHAPELCFVAGLAVAETAETFAAPRKVTLKWPNDVLLDGRKLGGILLEQEGGALALGIGVNLAQHPENMDFPATSLATACGTAPDPDVFLHRLAGNMAPWYEVWRAQGFGPVRDAWLARAAGRGAEIRARLGKSEVIGVFEDLDEDGALRVRAASGDLRRILAADVFFSG